MHEAGASADEDDATVKFELTESCVDDEDVLAVLPGDDVTSDDGNADVGDASVTVMLEDGLAAADG